MTASEGGCILSSTSERDPSRLCCGSKACRNERGSKLDWRIKENEWGADDPPRIYLQAFCDD